MSKLDKQISKWLSDYLKDNNRILTMTFADNPTFLKDLKIFE